MFLYIISTVPLTGSVFPSRKCVTVTVPSPKNGVKSQLSKGSNTGIGFCSSIPFTVPSLPALIEKPAAGPSVSYLKLRRECPFIVGIISAPQRQA